MSPQQLDKKGLDDNLSYYINNKDDISVIVYAILKNSPVAYRMDIEGSAQDGLKELFLESIKNNIIDNDDISILPLSSADERNNVIYHYDIEWPDELTSMQSMLGQQGESVFDFNVQNIEDIRVLLICIGNVQQQIILYKTMAPVNIFSRSGFFLKKSATRLEEIEDDFFRVSDNFQIIKVENDLYVVDLKLIEKMFGFHEVIKKEATLGMNAIESMNIITDINVIKELIDDVKYARKLTRIAKSSPVILANIENEKIIEFCKTYPVLVNRIRFNEDGTKIALDTKVSKDLFIKILMDDFLTSQLTQFYYESLAKDAVKIAADNTKEN
ncbi:TPA: DUF4868 domain-containing protein [Escherichia coli]|uniref:anti-phage protein KwaB n=1 Tax=Enterobacteriaceae TaxID=543 RepID=UPI0018005831|nr:anti-phage protein KwaB [Escherichia coli]HDS3409258.1 DUF4868 domain-containing protein [Citrobacter freundii]EFH3883641.1 DUF4868 domain-containing protein [Escherichia coli]EGM7822203.1 DUF4868 domain-containing protein [Escherichia coli]MCN2123571.1 DUF4868 domain-containing protein [Escherichia coli]MCU6289405.1 DUF4868 domain-containing protein [Escherichia coli]